MLQLIVAKFYTVFESTHFVFATSNISNAKIDVNDDDDGDVKGDKIVFVDVRGVTEFTHITN